MTEGELRVGITLPQWSELATPETWRRVASAVEDRGFDFVSKGDHIVFLDDDQGWAVDTPTYDQFLALSFAAGATDDLEILTNICVVPYRHPVHLAKLVLTLDAISNGRLTLGVGVGWYEPEFDVLDVPITERGTRADEFLDLFNQACEEPIVDFDGPFHSFSDVGFYPRPTQPDGPPVLIGGDVSASFRRAAKFGDGWILPASPTEIENGRERLERAWADFERDGSPIIAAEAPICIDGVTEEEKPLVGTPETVRSGVRAYREAGTSRLVCSIIGPQTTDEVIEQIDRIAEVVLPLT